MIALKSAVRSQSWDPEDLAKYDLHIGCPAVAPVWRNAVLLEVSIWTAFELSPIRENTQPWQAIAIAFQKNVPFSFDANDPPRRRARRGAGSVGIDRLGDACCVRRCACRSRAAHRAGHRRRLPSADSERNRGHGTGSVQTSLSSSLTTAAISSSERWKKTRTGPTTISRLGTTLNCRRRSDARIGIRRG